MRFLRCIALIGLALSLSAQVKPSQIPVPSDVAAPPADAAKTKSGVASEVIKPGNR